MLLSALYLSHALSASCLARAVMGAKFDGEITPSATSGHCSSTSVPARLVMPKIILGLIRWRLSSLSEAQLLVVWVRLKYTSALALRSLVTWAPISVSSQGQSTTSTTW